MSLQALEPLSAAEGWDLVLGLLMVAVGASALLAPRKSLPNRPWFLVAVMLPSGLLTIAAALASAWNAPARLQTAIGIGHLAYLGALVAVAVWWIARNRRRFKAAGRHPPLPPTAGVDREIRAILASGRKIEAIRRLREETGMSLKDAKDYVDALQTRPGR